MKSLTILNREFQHPTDGWYQIEALGEHPNVAAGIIQVVDAESAASIVTTFNREAAAGTLRHGSEMLIDHEHFKDQQDQETIAYGWLHQLQNRSDGIYGQIRWTGTGKKAVDGGDYRFFSTEYDPNDMKVLSKDPKARKVRPLRLDGLTVTNMFNNRGQRPITNRAPNFPGDVPADNQPHKKTMKSIASKLGLSAEASEEAILAEVTKVINRATDAEGKLVPLQTRVTTLEGENKTLVSDQIAADLDSAGIKETEVRNRWVPVLTGLKNREERLVFIKDLADRAGSTQSTEAGKGRVLNRQDGKAPKQGDGKTGTYTEADTARAQRIKNRADELKANNPSRQFNACWKQAEQEIAASN